VTSSASLPDEEEYIEDSGRAIELDPEFASPHGMAAWCYVLRKNYGWLTDVTQEIAETERLARRAVRLAKEDTVALYTGGFALARIAGYLDDGAALIDRALALDPNLAAAWHLSGWVNIYLGRPEIAIDHIARAMRLNPLDPSGCRTGSRPLIFSPVGTTKHQYGRKGRCGDTRTTCPLCALRLSGQVSQIPTRLLGRTEKTAECLVVKEEGDPERGNQGQPAGLTSL
jgi:tetratricopeptide (TPR) repeat protein